MAMTNAERQRAWRERQRQRRDEAHWQSWRSHTGYELTGE